MVFLILATNILTLNLEKITGHELVIRSIDDSRETWLIREFEKDIAAGTPAKSPDNKTGKNML